jgi:hypothetical protein
MKFPRIAKYLTLAFALSGCMLSKADRAIVAEDKKRFREDPISPMKIVEGSATVSRGLACYTLEKIPDNGSTYKSCVDHAAPVPQITMHGPFR